MTHKRKTFLVYPPNYTPGDGYKKAHSKRQAWKLANKSGCQVHEVIATHPSPFAPWCFVGGNGRVWHTTKRS